jgi:superfamily II DNA or RNA helicase
VIPNGGTTPSSFLACLFPHQAASFAHYVRQFLMESEMSLKTFKVKDEYRSLLHDVARDFYIPLLSAAILYRRAVGFFSSTILTQIADGVASLAENGGKIQIVASPYLSDGDIEAIKKGYEWRKIMRQALLREMSETKSAFEEERLNILANLIADDILDIKIAFTEKGQTMGMYHEKMGIITDKEDNTIAFSGSMNESKNALKSNYEVIDVWCSWKSNEQRDKIDAKVTAFTSIWNNTEPNIRILDFPELKQEILERYKCTRVVSYAEMAETEQKNIISTVTDKPWLQTPYNYPQYYDYQLQAMEAWKANGYRGIFDMATGTGKTLTALGALELLCREFQDNIGIIIVCPYQHLIEQWITDIREYGVTPIICYSTYDWKKAFKYALRDYSCGALKNFCVITTNATIATKYFQDEVDKLRGRICLVVDEAHNLGAQQQLNCMKNIYEYRLALSATLERHHDELGTKRLLDFFGDKCIEYSLERAINENKLTPYYYYPIPVYFDSNELDEYNELTEKIIKVICYNKNKKGLLSKTAEMLLIKRARIVAGARGKLCALRNIIHDEYIDGDHILVYCGATSVSNSSYKEGIVEHAERRQIDLVVDMLGNDLNMRVSKFTSEENAKEREQLKADFTKGDMLKVLVAIRCLDEGVNIPGIKTAFILASSTNPKEYVQRRGRVLRTAPGKQFAKIYDFITLPRNLNDALPPNANLNSEYSLIRREYERMEDFARFAENSSEVVKLQNQISDYYKLNYVGENDYGI